MSVFASCLPCLTRLRRAREEDPERQRLFPPPTHVLSPPRRRPNLPPIRSDPTGTSSGTGSASDPALASAGNVPTPVRLGGVGRGWSSPGLSTRGRERIGTISRAYQGRMHQLTRHSQPTTPSTAEPLFHHPTSHPASAASSATATPVGTHHRRTTPSSPVVNVIPESQETIHDPRNIDSTHFRANTKRLSAPHLGRSISEPRSLTHLAELGEDLPLFASHQMPRGGLASQLVARGRPRSATTLERMSPIHRPGAVSDDGDIQGTSSLRHSRHSSLHGDIDRESSSDDAQWSMSMGSDNQSQKRRDQEGESSPETEAGPSSSAHLEGVEAEGSRTAVERDREVVRVNLGLRGLGTAGGSVPRRGRRGGKSGKRRISTR